MTVMLPQLWDDVDGPRVRRSDPVYAHMAADRSQDTKSAVQRAVLLLVRQEGPIVGSVLNQVYRDRADRMDDPTNWPIVHWDSPRKRAGELARRNALIITNADHPRGTETEYALPTETREVAA